MRPKLLFLTISVLDTGLSVSTIGKSYYDEDFASNHPIYTMDELIHVEGAGGYTLPYLGFIIAKILVPGEKCHVKNISCILLIVPDVFYHKLVPVLLGTNALVSVMKQLESTYGVRCIQRADLNTSWQLVIRCLNLHTKTFIRNDGKLCVVKSASSDKISLPGNTTITIVRSLDRKINVNCMPMMQLVSESKLPSDVEIVLGLVNYDKHLQTVKVSLSNHSTSTFVISPRSVSYISVK